MKNVRIWFEKKDSARYISHLDMTRCVSRAFKLSGLPVWYTEGFNPRIYMTYAMPLSLGMQGERECMDIRLLEEVPFAAIAERLDARLPKDIHVLSAADPVYDFKQIAFAEYEMCLFDSAPQSLLQKLSALFQRETLPVMKHGKKGDKEIDIKKDFLASRFEQTEDGVTVAVRLPCSVLGSVNPGLLLDALQAMEGVRPYAKIVRKGLFLEDGTEFQ